MGRDETQCERYSLQMIAESLAEIERHLSLIAGVVDRLAPALERKL